MNKIELPKRKNPRLKGFDYSSPLYAYFITVCAKDKKSYFTDKNINIKVLDCLNEEKKRLKFLIYVYCLMPNHMHLLLSPPGDGTSVSRFIGGFKSKTTRIAWTFGVEGKLWHGRFYDHIVRRRENLKGIGEYILDNPVRKGLVGRWEDYQYSGLLDPW